MTRNIRTSQVGGYVDQMKKFREAQELSESSGPQKEPENNIKSPGLMNESYLTEAPAANRVQGLIKTMLRKMAEVGSMHDRLYDLLDDGTDPHKYQVESDEVFKGVEDIEQALGDLLTVTRDAGIGEDPLANLD